MLVILPLLLVLKCWTGDTICSENRIVELENITFPEPVIHIAIEPKTKVDQKRSALLCKN
jgi:translation elongation factor EF-G